jgi:hypothetical protein
MMRTFPDYDKVIGVQFEDWIKVVLVFQELLNDEVINLFQDLGIASATFTEGITNADPGFKAELYSDPWIKAEAAGEVRCAAANQTRRAGIVGDLSSQEIRIS